MARAGRKPMGPKLVERLDGSHRAKQRMEVILETIAGKLTINQACDRLGISEARFHQLRTGVLQAGLAQLEPRPLGRPAQHQSPEAETIADLEQQVDDLNAELKTADVRLEIAQVMPHLIKDEVKKTNQRNRQRKMIQRKQKQRRRKPR
jgi:hypothetical protein